MTTLSLDFQTARPLQTPWNFGANTCHAPLWTRPDLGRHLQMGRDQLGFSHVRAHDIFSPRFGIVASDGSFDYARVLAALQVLVDLQLTPFVELSSMPRALMRADTHIAHYKFRSSPPRDFEQWYRLVHGLVAACAQRFGREAVRSWYFEVWNEPDIDFWSGTQSEYFKLYDLSARAVKEVDSGFRIGGPATSKTAWIEPFLRHIQTPSPDFNVPNATRCDFISTHAYPSDLAYLEGATGEVKLQNSTIMRQLFEEVRRQVDAHLGAGFPVFIGEWNSSAGPYAVNHDTSNNGAFVAKTMTELEPLVQGSLFWNWSDIYEEAGFHYQPFHGGYGLVTVNDLPKAAFHAFRLLQEHRGERLQTRFSSPVEGLTALASRQGETTRLLLSYYQEPDVAAFAAQTIGLDGFPAIIKRMETVEPMHGSAHEKWLELGSPSYLNQTILSALEAATKPRVQTDVTTREIEIAPGTLVQLSF